MQIVAITQTSCYQHYLQDNEKSAHSFVINEQWMLRLKLLPLVIICLEKA